MLLKIKHVVEFKDCDGDTLNSIYAYVKLIHQQNKCIMDTQAQLVEKINTAIAQLGKIKDESTATLNKVSELQAIIDSQGGVSPELQEAVDKLLVQAKVVDDLIPDAIPPVEPPAEQPGL